ncbi:hypothetical protein YTPLAS73_13990 [Nitrosarchaeum sp.]|nr:hypothetical protein YTPLAS73_13990 [Nitrosarchaeum sp.]
MKSPVLEDLRECCENTKSHIVIYNGAGTGDLPVLVCDVCFDESSFQKFIVARYQLTKKTNIEQILKNHLEN